MRQVGDEVQIDVTADAFCHSMVRALVGSLMTVGELRVPIDRPAALQAAGKRSSEIHVAPAHGLTLSTTRPLMSSACVRKSPALAATQCDRNLPVTRSRHAERVIRPPAPGSTVKRACG